MSAEACLCIVCCADVRDTASALRRVLERAVGRLPGEGGDGGEEEVVTAHAAVRALRRLGADTKDVDGVLEEADGLVQRGSGG